MKTVGYSKLSSLVGEDLGRSDWFEITQSDVDRFVAVTHDDEWIHVDVERANREFGGTIANGNFILSLIPFLMQQIICITGVRNGLIYGLNKLRFTNMVRVGKRVRLHQKISAIEPRSGGQMITNEFTVEIEGEERPALVAEALFLGFGDTSA